ncbi:MFS transporter [Streptomyces ipomoeae]|uniref:MFS transporter n=1 Tax=Streptomyces ipomoeae TaxID=103232 RepID=UPI00215C334D|nr:MFS transporter [Streptomyces ipomoeae]
MVVPAREPLGRIHPQPLTKRPPFGRQPTTLRVPHTDGIPPGSRTASPRRHHAFKVSKTLKATRTVVQITKNKQAGTRPISAVFGDIRLYGLMLATISAWTVIYTYETVLPIVLSQSHGLSPSDWGRVYALGPALVVLFQLRIARWIVGFSPTFCLAAGTILMGAAFLTLMIQATLGAVLVLTLAFIVGNMIWGPASEQAALRLAPEGHQGAYLGVMSSSIWLGSALVPGLGLPLREHFGDTGLWIAVLSIALLSAASYLLTNRMAHTPGSYRKVTPPFGKGVGR